MRRTIRAAPALALGGGFGALVAGLLALASTPFLVRRMLEKTTSFEVKELTLVLGILGIALGGVAGAVAKVGAALLRQPGDPPPRRPPTRLSLGILAGAVIGGFFGLGLSPVFKALFAHYDATSGQFLLTSGRFIMLSLVLGSAYGVAAAGFVVAFAPSIAPVDRVARVRAQHLYDGPVRDMNDLAVLLNRIKEGGEDALAAGKEFYLQ